MGEEVALGDRRVVRVRGVHEARVGLEGDGQRVVVVGAGLTACGLALDVIARGRASAVTIAARRAPSVRQFDAPACWLGESRPRHMFGLLSEPDLRTRASIVAEARGPPSISPEVFERLQRVRQGPPSVVATYCAVLGIGFMGCYALPGADQYALAQLRRDLATQLGVDPDRDWTGGAIRPVRKEDAEDLDRFAVPWWKSLTFGRTIATLLFMSAASAAAWMFVL